MLETPGGQKLTLKDGPGSIEIADANGNSIKLESSGITVTTSREGDRSTRRTARSQRGHA